MQSFREIADWIKAEAQHLGFDAIGIAPAEPSARADYIREWFAAGRAGSMEWMSRHLDAKLDVRAYMPEARSVICVAINYHFPLPPEATEQRIDEGAKGRIARYALGDDYHEVFKRKLGLLADGLRQRVPGTLTRCCCDSSPLLEREYAARAGIGWIGRNTCIIHPRIGSWLLLGELIVSIDLPPDLPAGDHCGSCRRCIEACPTGAIAPYQMDPRLCISYLNIEHRGELNVQQQSAVGGWLFGCDICQDVCPFNRKAPVSSAAEFVPRWPDGKFGVDEIGAMDDETFRHTFRRSAIRRVKLPVLQANARAVGKNLASAPAADCAAHAGATCSTPPR